MLPLHILLVDDDPNLRLIAQMSLEEVGGFKVTAAKSGFEAIELATTSRYDAIVLDVMMPGMDGVQTFERLRQTLAVVPPVIFLTAKIQRHEMSQYLNLGAAGILTKPFDPMLLPSDIDEILSQVSSHQVEAT